MTPRRLIIISSSFGRKRDPKDPIPAIERFDGVYFRVARKYLREGRLKNTDIIVVSPEYGLLASEDKIPYSAPKFGTSWRYESSLSDDSVLKLRQSNLIRLKQLVGRRTYAEVYVNVGKAFMPFILGFEKITKAPIVWSSGRGLGPKAKHMKNWILREVN